ncbi:hypothetical protein EJ05DRAFT_496118 [Pseudovirgaria hyperparasitica]|uniref:Velvet domain-containing protein n=1 Tax=Pseudovirgaria hyperparasitica TaxID=470096 RepID=A0A6A6WMB6_9PEZI|nr:uncharacterized protein EJ05DRAFT_496118 [Pseudovirgaria hyperparasitica]KAF2763293.1 hypothetical protein EJ05DRAFT_496118 [Pseudovirgaria hyperparasitica]
MSRPPPSALQPPTAANPPSTTWAMTETQNPPHFQPVFHDDPYRRTLPPLSSLTQEPPHPRPDLHLQITQAQLPSIHPSPYAPRESPLHSLRPYTAQSYPNERPAPPSHYQPPAFSSSHYGAAVSPRSEYVPVSRQRTTSDSRYRSDDPRHLHVDSHFVSPVERKAPGFPSALPSPSYSSQYNSANNTIRNSFSSHASSAPSTTGPPAVHSEPRPPTARPAPRTATGPATRPAHSTPDPSSSYDYKLVVRQQPLAARACGFGERDRRVIDPPPIIQLQVTDKNTGIPVDDELRYGLHVLHCALWDPQGEREQTSLLQDQKRPTRRLMGQLVASPSVAKDEHDVEGCFFCFPDLSCRTHGQYTLRFVLMRIDPANLEVGTFFPVLTEVLSDVFTVYTAKDFPGMRSSSALTRALKLQGCNIQVKKGNDKAIARKRAPNSSDDDDGEEGKRRRKGW